MSVAFIDSPTPSSSQLFFTWPEAECVEAPQAEYSQAEKSTTSEILAKTPSPSLPASHEPCGVSSHSTGERRCGEVRIGSVMIRLLKRYGITDAEINEGLAEYAAKSCQSIAS